MDAKERSYQIISYLKSHKRASITALSDLLQVSEMTIRRDLDLLEKENVLFRVHGGARLVSSESYTLPTVDDRMNLQKEAKLRIGKYAASLVQPGDIISMDDSSTTYAMIPFLPHKLTVLTNYLDAVTALLPRDETEIILLGGAMRKSTGSTAGKDMERMLVNYHVGRVFISANALEPSQGIFDATSEQAESKRAYLAAGSNIYFLCDHTKLNTFAMCRICGLKEIPTIIMDACDDVREEQERFKEGCEKEGVQLVLV